MDIYKKVQLSQILRQVKMKVEFKGAFINQNHFKSISIRRKKKANEQYIQIEIKSFDKSLDRFLIIDNTEVYHLGASLKD